MGLSLCCEIINCSGAVQHSVVTQISKCLHWNFIQGEYFQRNDGGFSILIKSQSGTVSRACVQYYNFDNVYIELGS